MRKNKSKPTNIENEWGRNKNKWEKMRKNENNHKEKMRKNMIKTHPILWQHYLIFSHFFSFFLIFSHFDSQQLWPKHVMRKNEKKWEKMRKNKIQICERSVKFFRLRRALGVSFEKKNPACGGLGLSPTLFWKKFSRLRRARNFPDSINY